MAPSGMSVWPVTLVPPSFSAAVSSEKFAGENSSTFSTKVRDTMLPCMLPVSIVHLASFGTWCFSVSFRVDRT